MSLRKLAGLAAGLALSAGLIGSGVSAAFTSSVSAAQAINVGTFGCQITASSAGTIASGNTSVTYDAPTIISSAASSSPFTFTVTNTGSIPAKLHLTQTVPAAPFTSLLAAPVNDVILNQNDTHTYNAGLSWPELTNDNLGQSVSISYSVSCGEVGLVIFDNHPGTLPANLASIGPEAYSYNEFGAQVGFDGTARKLSTATVTMSSWACQTGTWSTHDCVTTPGATYTAPITFNVYAVGTNNSVGALLATKTQTFTIPFRPSPDTVHCTGNKAGEWYDGTSCFNGKAVNITFTFAGETLPNNAIFGIAFNTDNHGYAPLHTAGNVSPLDALNVAMYPGTAADSNTAVAPSVGSFLPDGLSAYLNDTYAPFYMDNGTGGTGTFRLDTGASTAASIGAYGGYEPSVQITAS